eukprot:scaffold7696_cov74-Skeletonema_dohrnii-CCMP3373.AAC.1
MTNASNESEDEEEYTTSYTKILLQQKYPTSHYYLHGSSGGGGRLRTDNNFSFVDSFCARGKYYYNSSSKSDNYRAMMQDDYSSRRRLGVRLIQQRWRRGGCTSKNHHSANNEDAAGLSHNYDDHDDADICHDDKRQKRSTSRDSDTDSLSCNNYSSPYNNSAGTTIANTTLSNNNKPTTATLSIQPTLLFRRTNSNLYYSNERHYTNIQFLNSGQPIVIGVDNYGDLDVVRVPSFGCGGYHCATSTNDNDEEDGGGIGTLQADRMPLCSSSSGANGPRVPTMDNFHCELFGYDNGMRFAVGLRSGRMQLFTTERAAAAAGNCLNEQREDTSSSLGSTKALWSCLPSTTTTTIGPQRRYHKSDKYPLSTMLSSTTNKTSLFDAYNTSFLEEISDTIYYRAMDAHGHSEKEVVEV